ncbi:MAG: long-chain fatty acid--CoA ligase [Archaeoglobaceae archaeon]|nr:long-chain fatty acid--CoA ligase [Archaeoglobaceae archaeon]MDW8127664.1 long-chain fatty acid--CoA ligase [Archaeoglobaceae archaeon]
MKVPDFIKSRFWLEKAWIKGVPADVEIPEKTICEVIDEACLKYSSRKAINFYGFEMSYTMLKNLIDRIATAFVRMGVKKGDTVALYLPNCPQFAIAYYGAMKAGATVTAISPLFAPREVEYQLNDSNSKLLVTAEQLYPNVAVVRKNTKLEKVIVANILGGPISVSGDVIDFSSLLVFEPKLPKIDWDVKEDVAVLQYTGGTTGLPKAAMLTHYNVVAQVYQLMPFTEILRRWLKSESKVIKRETPYITLEVNGKIVKTFEDYYDNDYTARVAILPWYHIYGQTVDLNSSLAVGDLLVVFARFEPEKILEAIEKLRIATFMGAPAIFVYYANNPEMLKKYDLSSLIYVNNGAGPIPAEIVKKWDELTANSIRGLLVEGYGLSEASPVTHTTFGPPFRQRKVGSVGPPIPNTFSAIVDPNTLEFLPIGKEGELVVSGPQVMKGYWNRPKETEDVFFYADGMKWLRTGDIAKMDEDGYVYIVDRLKDIIKYKGHSVYPREIEDVIYEHPAVQEVCVVGIPDPEVGENIKAFVVLKPDYRGKLTEKELIEWCKERLAAYKYPRIVEFREELPKSAAGKYLRRLLREESIRKGNIK